MDVITIDKKLYPIVIVKSNNEFFEGKDVDRYIEQMTDFIEITQAS